VVLDIEVKLPGGNAYDGGVHILAWWTCFGSGESSSLPMTASLVSLSIGVPSDLIDQRRGDNSLASSVLLIFTDVVLLVHFMLLVLYLCLLGVVAF
jgi:hypothetical protein